MAMMYINKTPKMQVMNLRSGKSLFVDPHSKVMLEEGEEHSPEVKNKVAQKTGMLIPAKMERPVMPAMPQKPTVSMDEVKSATVSKAK